MKEIRHLANAPIKEAIINLRVTHAEKVPDQKYSDAIEALKDTYPNSEKMMTHEFGYKIEKGHAETMVKDHGQIGVKLDSADENYVAHFKSGEFLLSRVGHYEDWPRLISEAKRLWDIYVKIMEPVSVSRISTRYINEISVPKAEIKSLDDVFEQPIRIPEKLLNPISSFLQRYVLELDDEGTSKAIVSQVLRSITEQTAEFVLDTDVVKNFEGIDPNSEEVWTEFDSLHDCKNTVFFESLTEQTIRRFE